MPRISFRPSILSSLRTIRPSQPLSLVSPSPARSLTSTAFLRPSLLFSSRSILSPTTTPSSSYSPILSQLRFVTYGCEYQPSQRKRKRKHGFLVRLKKRGKDGVNMLKRRREQGRRFLSH